MDDQDRTKEQLLAELAALRQRVSVLEQTEKSLRESEAIPHFGRRCAAVDGMDRRQ